MNQKLIDLLQKKQKQSAPENEIDWDERKKKFLSAVEQLYGQLETMLAEPIGHKKVQLHRRPKVLTENFIGTYAVNDLILVVGDEQVRFSPRGRNIVGSAGRIDVVGEKGEAMLILKAESKWEIVQTRQPAVRSVPLDESSLAEVLQLVMRD